MRVNQLNMDLEAARQTVMETYAPGEDDLYMRTLEVAQVDSDDYFQPHRPQDLDRIVKDIQTAHTSDTTTADERQPTVAEIQRKFAQLSRQEPAEKKPLFRYSATRWKSLMIR